MIDSFYLFHLDMDNHTNMETKTACAFTCPLLFIGGFKVKSFYPYSAAEDAQEIK